MCFSTCRSYHRFRNRPEGTLLRHRFHLMCCLRLIAESISSLRFYCWIKYIPLAYAVALSLRFVLWLSFPSPERVQAGTLGHDVVVKLIALSLSVHALSSMLARHLLQSY